MIDSTTTPDFRELVSNAMLAASLVFGTKIIATFVLAQLHATPMHARFWMGFIPHATFNAPDATFSSILTWSMIAMAVVALILVVHTIRQHEKRSRQRLLGRLIAPVVAVETLVLHTVFVNDESSLLWPLSWIAVLTAMIAIGLLALPLWSAKENIQ